jgi:glycine/D-amino acid oxidase-like deaminating enzyme
MGDSERSLFDSGRVEVSRSGWQRGAHPLELPRLEGEHRADVAVIGAGLAGASLALHLAERGAGVALVEAREPGWGASGRNAGHVVPYRDLDRAFERLPDRGEALLALLRDGGGIVYELARRHGIECDAVQGGYIQVAHRESLVAAAERKAEKWARRGHAVRFVDRHEVAALTGSQSFHGGTLAEHGGRVNPLAFTLGMLAAALRAGASAFARSPVDSLRGAGNAWRVTSARGCVVADRVVVCTNGYSADLVPRAWCPLVAFALALEPLPEPIRASILPGGAAISEFPSGFHPLLVDRFGRIVTSSLPGPIRPHIPPLRWATRWLRRTYPQTRDAPLRVEAYWTGAMAWSPDQLPRIFEAGPGLLALMCFSGEGNVLAPLLGRHLAEALASDALRNLALPVKGPTALRFRGRYDWLLRRVAVPLLGLTERFRPSAPIR